MFSLGVVENVASPVALPCDLFLRGVAALLIQCKCEYLYM